MNAKIFFSIFFAFTSISFADNPGSKVVQGNPCTVIGKPVIGQASPKFCALVVDCGRGPGITTCPMPPSGWCPTDSKACDNAGRGNTIPEEAKNVLNPHLDRKGVVVPSKFNQKQDYSILFLRQGRTGDAAKDWRHVCVLYLNDKDRADTGYEKPFVACKGDYQKSGKDVQSTCPDPIDCYLKREEVPMDWHPYKTDATVHVGSTTTTPQTVHKKK